MALSTLVWLKSEEWSQLALHDSEGLFQPYNSMKHIISLGATTSVSGSHLYHNWGTGDITELVGTWLRQLGALGVVGASSGLLVPQLPALAL